MGNILYVDLDGTFIKSDMLIESFIQFIKKDPLAIFKVFFWLLKGREFLKAELAKEYNNDVLNLPVNKELYNFLLVEKQKGRCIILATASNEKIAELFVAAYPLFDGYIASSEEENLKGIKKLAVINKKNQSFDYIGNSIEDYEIFKHAQNAYLVAPTSKALKAMKCGQQFEKTFDLSLSFSIRVWTKQLRIHQWVKNLLIFVPLLVSGSYLNIINSLSVLTGFIAFSLLASSTYILNDLLDLDSDRIHKTKKFRPLASGEISIIAGAFSGLALFIISIIFAYSLNFTFLMTLLIYLILTVLYSVKIKQFFSIDVLFLASLYTIRIFAGAAIIGVTVSFWLLSFSMFIFLSLALVKRCAELVALKFESKKKINGRDYNVSDLNILSSFGASSSMISILMYCFYINNTVLSDQYQEPSLLWLSLPALGYWLMRMWVKTMRGEMNDDPVVYSLKDRTSLIAIFIMALITISAHTV